MILGGVPKMIKPSKYTNPDKTIINVAQYMLKELMAKRIVTFDELRSFIRKKISGVDVLFLPSLNFLYLMGVIEYRTNTDSILYTGSNETIETVQ